MKEANQPARGTGFVPKLLFMVSIVFLTPLLMLLPFAQDRQWKYVMSFFLPAVAALLSALVAAWWLRRFARRRTGRQQAVVTVMLLWCYVMALGALPFLAGGQLRLVPALLESVSGWTTTGMTVLPDIDNTPHIFLFYRGFMQFCGGLGFVLILLLFAGGREASKLFSAEGHSDMLEPNLISTARHTMYLYLGMVTGGALLYIVFGMDWFEAVNHSMSALGTGGFSPRGENIGAYDSLPIELITILLMLLGATNFAALALMFKGKWRSFFKMGEVRFFLLLVGGVVLVIALLGKVLHAYQTFGASLRDAVFLAVSAVSTTGYSINSVDHWRPPMLFLIFVLMFIGGASGSTAGGIKYTRVYVLSRSFAVHLRAKFLPERAVSLVTVQGATGKFRLTEAGLAQHQRVALVYLATFFGGAFLLSLDPGIPTMEDAMFEFASSLSTTGLSDYTNAEASNYVMLIQTVGMIFARMEVYMVYVFMAAGIAKLRQAKHKFTI
ncbi:MAG: TrkH family potassium uptake protein [Oscillospiraceae bacterium]|nr:TrkH family potassium uptake protein [Oscillospiraceae bacterium]